MKIVFMGTPEFAVPCFNTLLNHHDIIGVVTVPDKPAGRGRKLKASAIKQAALDAGIPVAQPEDLKSADFINQLKEWNADLYAVVAFRILPEIVFTIPPKGTVNLHASLLPQLRGAAPINWALINGDNQSGVTTFFIERKVDTGNILLQQSVELTPYTTAGELHDKLSGTGAQVLLDTCNGIEENTLKAQPQKGEVTLAPKITKELCNIDWNQSAENIHNLIRGLSPFPGAFSYLDGKQVKIIKTDFSNDIKKDSFPGRISQTGKAEILVETIKGTLIIKELKPEGKRSMAVEEYLRGNSLESGKIFGEH